MKKQLLLLTGLLLAFSVFSQSPDAFKYQASLKDGSGDPLASQTINVVISIVQDNISGLSVYSETHEVTTDPLGNVNLEIGKGTTTDNFSDIDWVSGVYFIKISVNGNDLGAFQLLTVPYAKYADKAGNVFSGNYNDLSNLPDFANWDTDITDDFSGNYHDLSGVPDLSDTANYVKIENAQSGDILYYNGSVWETLPKGNDQQVLVIENNLPVWKYISVSSVASYYVGKMLEDGIIFYVSPDGEHGLIASLYDLDDGTGAFWSEITSIEAFATSWYDGKSNTDSILAQGPVLSAAQLCKTLGEEWYLPSAWEFTLLFNSVYEINKVLDNDDDSSTHGLLISGSSPEGRYWTSTENGLNRAWSLMINYGNNANSNKNTKCRIRAIKKF